MLAHFQQQAPGSGHVQAIIVKFEIKIIYGGANKVGGVV